jgi:shikimate kinase
MNSSNSINNLKSVILLGYMGSGKTSIGKILAKKNNCEFIDLDKVIEKKYNSSVSKIFSDLGELEFRKIEKQMLNEILNYDRKFILSLGGGTPCYFNNMDMILSKSNNVFYIKVPTNTLSNRLFLRKKKRPIISNIQSIEKMNEFVSKHIFERMPFYEKSNYVIESSRNDKELVVKEISNILSDNGF